MKFSKNQDRETYNGKEFTAFDAYDIQKEHLKAYEKFMTDGMMVKLVNACHKANASIKYVDDVPRGMMLDKLANALFMGCGITFSVHS